MSAPALTLADYRALVGAEVGCSDWMEVGQARIDAFAEVTDDDQFIHVDPERARETPFGGTIAHGFLTLSLLSRMAYDTLPRLAGVAMSVNYGMNSLRFLAPVRAGARIRGRFALAGLAEKGEGRILLTHDVTVEIENQPKPALVAQWLSMLALA
ncbi:MaoC family dehydratase [Acidiphilium sp. C61]|uniref:MaoC family dehydratase n=1 Tax=Acidiphilium sp. C61 TaxID=1671485 RepID=UPI00157A6DF9|nr:MaoC family dehydratase [Acidiphilium sp. C61]